MKPALICLLALERQPVTVILLFAGCGETVKGAVEGQPGTGQGEGGVSADTLNRVMPSDQLLDYSMDEDDADRREIT
ncbi:MAG: hypothetical protein ACK559_26100, partial [bacterium]